MPSTDLTFTSLDAHRAWLASQAALPAGFRIGTTRFEFIPFEVHKPAKMTLTLITLDKPTSAFAAMFTKNAFPGAPVIIGRKRLTEPTLGAVIVNNKISNVCAPGGVETSERLCAAVAKELGLTANQVLPSSTGVIGWKLPVDQMLPAIPLAKATLQAQSILPGAEGIVTTDLYPKIRRVQVGKGSIVGIAKGAGMIEPNLATMLVYLLTDLDVPREALRTALAAAIPGSFNSMSIDSDTSTSDTVALLSSQRVPCPDLAAFQLALNQVCRDLAEDIARNGEGVHHVMRVQVSGAPSVEFARSVGKSVVNSPLFQCAVCGNDPNVGRLVCAIGKHVGAIAPGTDLVRAKLTLGGQVIYQDGAFRLSPVVEEKLIAHLKGAELYTSTPPADGLTFVPPIKFPPHERCVEIGVDLGLGSASATVIGTDRSHEYISENADYRS
ncbi:MAG TPA: bifunctional ornithine acetyltransferase/N-acetylglutamate synthase, partial [Planctomycetota bacterium]|jgi:glutamate N-acetyltransferase/amino-acid N-acetyltransferase|nr:bifunctional ornithine acetyltransferase/N-acetylglutamate synthase [Planctomycetota bacterium]